MVDEKQCVLCGGCFRPNAMEGNKCKLCAKLYPEAKTKEDIKMKTPVKGKTLSDETVREIVYEILEESMGIKRTKCEKCNNLFWKRSPAQKYCSNCKDKNVE